MADLNKYINTFLFKNTNMILYKRIFIQMNLYVFEYLYKNVVAYTVW